LFVLAVQDGYRRDVLVDEEGDGVCLNFPAVTSAATEMTSERARHWFLALFAHDRSFVDDTAAAGGWRVTIAETVEAEDDCPVCRALRPRGARSRKLDDFVLINGGGGSRTIGERQQGRAPRSAVCAPSCTTRDRARSCA